MKKLLSLLAVGICLTFGAAHAQEKAKSPQQNKMAMCNKDATGKKGDERKAFMKTCLSAKADKTGKTGIGVHRLAHVEQVAHEADDAVLQVIHDKKNHQAKNAQPPVGN